jgi:acetoin utilization protein AcuB
MLVKNWMSKEVITIDVNDSMMNATKKLREHDIRMLPVMKKGKLVGVITDRDLKKASASDATTLEVHELLYLISEIKVKNIMSDKLITVPADYTVEETAEVLLQNKISGVPVLDDQERLVGVITQNDLFEVLIALTAERKRGVQFAFQLEDRPGSIKDVTDIIRKYGARIACILSSGENAPAGWRDVFVRAYQIDREKLANLQKDLKDKATMLYMVDHRENKRVFYEMQ